MAPSPPEWRLTIWSSPLGPLCLTFNPNGLARLEFIGVRPHPSPAPRGQPIADLNFPPPDIASLMTAAIHHLAQYFAGLPTDFASLPLDLKGTGFQLRVWQKLREIPWGATISYGDLAARLGKPNATRAVGQANGANPIPLIIPCHRVIKADGSLGGYSSGPEQKRWLLQHEGAMRG